jgi:hypothetical protein
MVDMASSLSGASGQRTAEIDSELAMLIAAWSNLPEPIRMGIAAMVRSVLRK